MNQTIYTFSNITFWHLPSEIPTSHTICPRRDINDNINKYKLKLVSSETVLERLLSIVNYSLKTYINEILYIYYSTYAVTTKFLKYIEPTKHQLCVVQ